MTRMYSGSGAGGSGVSFTTSCSVGAGCASLSCGSGAEQEPSTTASAAASATSRASSPGRTFDVVRRCAMATMRTTSSYECCVTFPPMIPDRRTDGDVIGLNGPSEG